MNFLNWNTEWAEPGTRRGQRVTAFTSSHQPEVACLTEAYPEILPPDGHVITSSDKTGYKVEGYRRKVVLWSQQPWRQIWQAEETDLPGGRFISGVTAGVRIVGLGIPWRMAHVTTGARNREAWEDHITYLRALVPTLSSFLTKPEPVVVTGDWNQRIPRTRQPQHIYEALMEALVDYEIVTSGILPEAGEPLIDHLALSPQLSASRFRILPKRDGNGKPLSDHIGYSIQIS